MSPTLYYIHDPMCSWCWAFRPALRQLRSQLPPNITLRPLLGGLAPDTSAPMPIVQQDYLKQVWQQIQNRVPGTRFNYDFWKKAEPRRSTYPACRAVLATRAQQPELEESMITAIQAAYYQRALNPSDDSVLIQLAGEIGLSQDAFSEALNSADIQQQLLDEIEQATVLDALTLPSLVIETANGKTYPIAIDYTDPSNMLADIQAILIADA